MRLTTKNFVRKVFVCGLVAYLASASTLGWAATLYSEDWESGSIGATDWTKWGHPDPVLQTGGNAQGSYSFDPNGDANYLSGVVSTDTFSLQSGLRVSMDAYVQSASVWSWLSFGLANTTAVTPTNVHLTHLSVITIDADLQGSGYNFYTKFDGAGGVVVDYADTLPPTAVFNGWHNYAFEFKPNGSAQVLVDGVREFETAPGLFDYSVDNSFALLIGGRSYGSTVNLFDSVQVSQAPEPATVLMLLLGSLMLLFARRRH